MNIEKAIIYLSEVKDTGCVLERDYYVEAVQLGIEALKRIQDGRSRDFDYFQHWLPGETKE